jgi:hypothetical protein
MTSCINSDRPPVNFNVYYEKINSHVVSRLKAANKVEQVLPTEKPWSSFQTKIIEARVGGIKVPRREALLIHLE